MKAVFLACGILSASSILLTLGGCAEDARPDVPSDAMQASSGGKVVSFTAPHDGKAYLRDDTDNRVVYSNDLRRDQVMKFDPALDVVQIDGKTVPEGIANPSHDHSIYFSRAAQPDRAGASDSNVDSNGVPIVRVPIKVEVQPQSPTPN